MLNNFEKYNKLIEKNEIELNFQLFEGIDIDKDNKKVSYNPNHQDNVDTSIDINPTYYKFRDIDVISIFKRIKNADKTDGNPLVYALKNHNNWKIDKKDIINILKQFIKISNKIENKYDTIITIPSSSDLNNKFLYRLNKIIKCDNIINDMFHKMESCDVLMDGDFNDMSNVHSGLLHDCFTKMATDNDGIFSYKYIPKHLRKYVNITIKNSYIGNELVLSPMINDKDVLILDDTISSGQTISEVSKNILDTYDPKSLTVITLFSNLDN